MLVEYDNGIRLGMVTFELYTTCRIMLLLRVYLRCFVHNFLEIDLEYVCLIVSKILWDHIIFTST